MSAPAQKPLPAPVMTMPTTAGSRSARPDGVAHLPGHRSGPRVQRLGAVQGDRRHWILDLVEDVLVVLAHGPFIARSRATPRAVRERRVAVPCCRARRARWARAGAGPDASCRPWPARWPSTSAAAASRPLAGTSWRTVVSGGSRARGDRTVVEADDRQIVGDDEPELLGAAHHAERQDVGEAQDRRRPLHRVEHADGPRRAPFSALPAAWTTVGSMPAASSTSSQPSSRCLVG